LFYKLLIGICVWVFEPKEFK